ncbi:sensor histidine kinase [Sphaerimonospora cavernae]|uniref:Sensor histidine kinase n=1 Tax=Sphaerimonospora cavernae TaxID=1740611 RepID=A0ABV6U791_9ACTN
MDDGLRRARRVVRWTMYVSLTLPWFFVALATPAALEAGTTTWFRTLAAGAGLVVFSWLYVRIVRAVLDYEYARRDVVVAAAVSLAAALIGGSQMMGWGFVPISWLSVAALGVSRRSAFLLGAGTAVVVTPLTTIATLRGHDPTVPTADLAQPGVIVGVIVSILGYHLAMCCIFPWTNRLWVWIWRLAEEAHAGREAQARLAVAEERLRFARDLHDLVGHQLSAIAVKSEVAVRLSAADVVAAREEMSAVRGLARTALRELREAVRGYRRLDLTAELGAVRGVLEAAGVSCHLHLPYREMSREVAPVFAWVVREAVTNVLRHSSASRCDIVLRHSEKEAVLEVRNDGVAPVASRDADGGGNGLAGLTERMAEIGGTLTAQPTGSGEFTLRAVAPMPVASAGAVERAKGGEQVEVTT